jgi:hypothetical protein
LASERTTEFEQSVLTYYAVRKYGIDGLETLAKNEAESLGLLMSILEIQRESEKISSKVPQDDTWFYNFVQQMVSLELNINATLFAPDGELLAGAGRHSVFDRVVVCHMATLLQDFNQR